MKKIIFALAAVAALAACSKSEVEYDAYEEIAFTPVAKNITKSMITGTAFPTTAASFNVWAWYNQVSAGKTPAAWNTATDNLYITKGEFVPSTTTGIWKGSTSYYWPKVGSLLFAGYYHSDDDDVSYDFDATTNQMVFSEIQQRKVLPSSSSHTEDLMYFNMTSQSYNAGPVPVVFKHALSWVTVNLKNNGYEVNTNGYPKITIHNVDFTNVNPQGTGTVTGTDGTITWVVNGTAADTPITVTDVVLTDVDQTQQEMLFIPQALTVDDPITQETEATMSLKVRYTISSSATESFTETLYVPLNGMAGKTPSLSDPSVDTDITINSWDPAKHYIYNIIMGLEEILIEPTVADWTPVEANLPI